MTALHTPHRVYIAMTGFGYAEETGNGVFFFFCETRAGSEGATLQQNSSASFCFEFRAWPSVTAEVADENTAAVRLSSGFSRTPWTDFPISTNSVADEEGSDFIQTVRCFGQLRTAEIFPTSPL